MLTGLKIGNFKAFGETQHIPIRPLTLIFGANSSGKSSIIHALLLLHHTQRGAALRLYRGERRRAAPFPAGGMAFSCPSFDVQQPFLSGTMVDLGGFGNYVHRHDQEAYVTLGLDVDTTSEKFRESPAAVEFDEALPRVRSLALRLEVGRRSSSVPYQWYKWDEQTERLVPEMRLPTEDVSSGWVPSQRCEFLANGGWVARFRRIQDARMELVEVNPDHPLVRLCARVQRLTNRRMRGSFMSLYTQDAASGMARREGSQIDPLDPSRMLSTVAIAPLFPELYHGRGRSGLGPFDHEIDANDWVVGPLRQLSAMVRTAVSEICESVVYLGGIRALPPRRIVSAEGNDANWDSAGMAAWRSTLTSESVLARVNAWLDSPDRLASRYQLRARLVGELDGLFAADEAAVQGAGAGAIAMLRDAAAGSRRSATQELVMVDRRCGTVVTHRDVGMGIGQILPVLVHAYGREASIVAIEQPELHLHPAMQAELGDVFIESALGERKNTFLLETHSEHLILRIMRRMRETKEGRLPKGLPEVRPEHVSVIFVEPGPNGSIAREMPLNDRGELIKSWPGGFFEEGYREMFS